VAMGHGERGARAYNGNLGAKPTVGASAQGAKGAKPPEAASFEAFVRLKEDKHVAVRTPRPSKYEPGHQSKTAASQFSSLQRG